MRRAVKTNNAKKFAHKALAVSLALAMAVSPLQMAGSVKAYAAGSPAGMIELKSTTLTDAHFYGNFNTPNAVVDNGDYYTMTITTEGGYILPDSVTNSQVVKIIDRGDGTGHLSMTLLSKSGKLNASVWQEILRNVQYTKTAQDTDMTVKVSLDSNETNVTEHITNFDVDNVALTEYNGHYYMFVNPEQQDKLGVHFADDTKYTDANTHISWTEAYNQSRQFMLNGMRGYLVTVDTAEERSVLHNISNKGAWTAGTALVKTGTTTQIHDELKIDRTQAGSYEISSAIVQHEDLDRANQGEGASRDGYHNDGNNGANCAAIGCTLHNTGTDQSRTVQESVFDDYYWACGPNAGALIPKVAWGTNTEPNHMWEPRGTARQSVDNGEFESCVMANREGGNSLNDLVEWNSCSTSQTYHALGYFVEFGGYPNDDTINTHITDPTTTTTKLISNKTINVTEKIDNATITDPTTGKKGEEYTTKVVADDGYKRPETVTVKVGSTTLTPDVDYVYDNTTGDVTVKEHAVTDDISIEGKAAAKDYPVTNKITNTKPEDPTPAKPGVEYKVTLTPNTGYKLPETVTVKVNGVAVPEASYNPSTGVVTVPKNKVTGPIEIEGTATALPGSYPVTNKITNTKPEDPTPATEGVEYKVTLTPNAGYKLPETVTVKVNGVAVPEATYNPTTGVVTVPKNKVTGPIEIEGTAKALPGSYPVTNKIANTKPEDPTPATEGVEYKVTLTPNTGYELPKTVTVKVNGVAVPEANYNPTTGVVTVPKDKVTGPIEIEGSAVPTSYPVTNNVTNTKPTDPTPARTGEDYTVTLTPDDGFKLPDDVKVTVGGEEIPNAYDPTTGTVTVPKDKVTGPIAIEGEATPDSGNFTVTNNVPFTTNGKTLTPAEPNVSYEVFLTPAEGKELPDEVKVTVSGVELVPETDFNYHKASGQVDIHADKVTGPIVLASANPVEYDVTNKVANTTPATPDKATEGVGYETKLVPNDGYKLPDNVTVKVNGTPVEGAYDPTTGKVSVPADKVTGPIEIEGTAVPKTYPVKNNVANTEPTNPEPATPVENYQVKLTPEDGYKLPETVKVKVGSTPLDPTEFTYNPETGEVAIPKEKVKGTIEIDGTAVPSGYPVKNDVANTEPTNPEPAKPGEDYKVKLTPEENYKLPETVTVKVGDKPLDPTEFTYNPETGEVTIPKDKITGPIDIEGNAIPTAYPVANKVDNTTPAKPEAATPDKKYEVTLTPDAGYKLPETVTVKVNDVPLTDGYFYDPADGKLTITAAKVNGPIAIEGKADLLPGRVPVENNVKNTEPTKPEPAKEGEDYKVTLTPEDGYKLPDDVKVKVDGKELDPKDYEYDPKTGDVTIPKEKVTGPIEMEGTATPVPKTPLNDKDVPNKPADNVDITFDPENPANTGLQIADDGSIKPMPYDGKEKKPVPTVTVDGKPLVPGKDYDVTYDDNTDAGLGKMTITGKGDYTGTLTKDIPIEKAVPKINVPETSDLDLGEPVNNSTLTGGNGIGVDGKPLPGKFAWSSTDPLTKDNAGKKVHYVTFTPDDTKNYSPVTFTVAVNEKKPGVDPAPNPAPGELPAPIEYNGQTAQPMPTGNEGDPKYDAAVKKMLDDEGEYGSNLPILLAKGKDTSKGKKEKMNLSWLKFDGAEGYMIYWNYCDGTRNYKLLTTVKGVNKLKYVDKKIADKKLKNKYKSFKYYVIAYKTINGQKCAIAKSPTIHVAMTKYDKKYTNAKTVTIKKGKKTIKSLSLKNGKSAKIKGVSTKENNKKKMLNHDKGMRYYSSNKKVAKVGRTTGKVIATGKGKCKIYAIACNGNRKDIKVTVK